MQDQVVNEVDTASGKPLITDEETNDYVVYASPSVKSGIDEEEVKETTDQQQRPASRPLRTDDILGLETTFSDPLDWE